MAGKKKKDGCAFWLIGLFVKSTFGREREVERNRWWLKMAHVPESSSPLLRKLSTYYGPHPGSTPPTTEMRGSFRETASPPLQAAPPDSFSTATPHPLTCPRWQDATSEGGAVVQRLGGE